MGLFLSLERARIAAHPGGREISDRTKEGVKNDDPK